MTGKGLASAARSSSALGRWAGDLLFGPSLPGLVWVAFRCLDLRVVIPHQNLSPVESGLSFADEAIRVDRERLGVARLLLDGF